jgi:transposase InsO family protein
VKFAFIEAEKASFPITFMCRRLEVSRSGFYAWRSREESNRSKTDRELAALILVEFNEHPRGCGRRMLVAALREKKKKRVGHRRVARLMRLQQLAPRLNRRFRPPSSTPAVDTAAPNVLERNFAAGEPNKVWATDITFIHTRQGWSYLAVVIDVGSRRVVGWSVSERADQQLALQALQLAVEQRRPAPGLIHHSDRGVQYTAFEYQRFLHQLGAVPSMSRRGNCWDNAVVESFFSALKREQPHDGPFEDIRELKRVLFAYIEGYYNTRRHHSALGYETPNRYEQLRAA